MGRSSTLTMAVALATLAATQTQAGAFLLREGSAAAQGAAWAGRTSGDRDVSFALHNPAALRAVENLELTTGFSAAFGSRKATLSNRTGLYAAGTASDDALDDPAFIPAFVAGWRANRHLVLGLAAQTSFGALTTYDNSFGAALDGTETELMTIAVTPMLAVEPVPGFSFGGGVTVQYAKATFGNFIPAGAPGAPFAQSIQGDGVEVSARLGVLADVTESTTLGLAAHLGYDYELEGDFTAPFFTTTSSGPAYFATAQSGTAQYSLPAVLSLGVTHDFTDAFRMMAEFEWSNWSVFDKIALSTAAGPLTEIPNHYEDSMMVAVGGEYDLNEKFTLRGGFAYDETPTSDVARSQRVPDGDRVFAAVGASYEITDSIGMDAAYTYVHVMDSEGVVGSTATGGARINYSGDSHLLSLNLRAKF